jgi:hypothetical protein
MTHEICDPPSDRSRGGRDGTRAQSKVRSPMSKVEKAGRDSVGPGPVRTLLIDGTGHRRNGIGRDGMAGVRGRRAGTKRDLLVVGIRFHIRGSQIPTKLGRVIEVGTGHAVLSSESRQNPSDRRRQGRSGLPLAGTGHGTGQRGRDWENSRGRTANSTGRMGLVTGTGHVVLSSGSRQIRPRLQSSVCLERDGTDWDGIGLGRDTTFPVSERVGH